MIRIGVISDTHNRDIPQQVWDDFKKVDMIIHAGDICEEATLKKFLAVTSKVWAVYGNMDNAYLRQSLPNKQIIHVEEMTIGICHGYGPPSKVVDSAKEIFKNDKIDVIVFGHSHCPYNQQVDGVLYFNPGSATDNLCSPYCSYGIIEIDHKKAKGMIVKIG